MARFQLLDKAEYIEEQSKSPEVADKFIDDIERLAEKLSYIASAYNDGKFYTFPLKKWTFCKIFSDKGLRNDLCFSF